MRASVALGCVFATIAGTSLASGGTINEFNLVVFNNHETGSNVWGRVAVGGNMSGNAIDIGTKLQPSGNYYTVDTLIVGGNITTNNINLAAGDVRHAGTINANINRNGGGATHQQIVHDLAAIAMVDAMETETRALSSMLEGETTNSMSGMGSLSNRYTFTTGVGSAGGTAVFNVNSSIFSSGQWADFTINNAANAGVIVINVDASGTNGDVSFTGGNFNGFAGFSDRLIWNFYNADLIFVQRELFGSMLGVNAHLHNFTNLNGSVVVSSMRQQGEVHGPSFGPQLHVIPLPGAGAIAMAGMGVLALRRRRATF